MNTSNKLFKVGIYLRLSNEDKIKNNILDVSESIKNQKFLLLDYINKMDDFILVDEYIDENLSGAGTYRPEFERLIKDCENRKIDIVLCKSQSRFSRDIEIIEKYLNNKFIEWGIRFIGLSDNVDTNNISSKKTRQINGLINEWFLEDVSNNIKSAFRAKMINGEYISPFCVYGYKIDSNNNNKLIIDDDVCDIVKKIFFLYLKGYGYMGIAKYLNDNKIPSPSYYKYLRGIKLNIVSKKARDNIKWSSNSVKSILTNEIYLGHLIQGKRTTISYKNNKIKKKNKKDWIKVLNTHDAIIDEELFKKVQQLIQKRSKSCNKNYKRHLLSGKVFCSLCGGIMKKKNSNKYSYLVCSNSQYNLCINKKGIRYDELEIIILNNINKLISDNYDKNLLVNFFNNNYLLKIRKKLEKEYLDISNKLKSNDLYIKELYEDKVNGNILKDRFNKLMFYYEENNINYKNKLKELNGKINSLNIDTYFILDKYKSFDKLNEFLILYFINKIVVGEGMESNRIIKIDWL